ncbi:hypothetical protein GW17_00060526 [Ensete ventricosum]|nr:hypothetical protein GW17_00060526 [Ensete ventricosum]
MASPHARPATHGQAAGKAPYKGAVSAARRSSSPQGRPTLVAGVVTPWQGGRRRARAAAACVGVAAVAAAA